MALTRVTSGGIAPGVQITFDQNNNPSSPAITFEGTPGTGIYSPANNTLSFATGGVERLKIGPSGELTVGSLANPVYIPVTDSAGPGGSNPNGKTVYVNCNDSKADDSLTNNGENLNRPFKSIERALIQAARISYVAGTGSEAGAAGADKFEYTSIIVYPGQYEVDNRPGEFVGSYNSGNPADSYQGDYSTFLTAGSLTQADFYKFNSLDGGIILPRGTSIVGLDLRKTVIRPKYVPDANSGTEGAIFRLTGGCYVWQLTIKDAAGQPYYNKSQQYSDANRSHHKLVGFKFATVGDLASYYRKIDHVDTAIPATGSSVYELFQRVEENRIVGNSTNSSTIDSVASASPYVFNCSLRSIWGMSGMHADGNDASGFRSMVVAQYTGISLQKDDRAFFLDGTTTSAIQDADSRHRNPNSTYVESWRHYHIKASNSSFIQIVSVFAVGFADHFYAASGGDLSITNSNSNFGNRSLRAQGFQDGIFSQNNKGAVTALIPPKGVDPTNVNNLSEVTFGYINVSKTLGVANANSTSPNSNGNFKILYLGQPVKQSDIPEVALNEGGTTTRYLVLGNSYQYTLGKKNNEKIYLDFEGAAGSTTVYQENVRFSSSANDPYYNLHNNDTRYGYGWEPISSTVNSETLGYIYVKVTYAPTATSFASGDNGVLKKVFEQTATTTSTPTFTTGTTGTVTVSTQTVTTFSYNYFYGLTKQPYITRIDDKRGQTGGKDLLWRLEYTIPKTATNAKAPEERYVIYPRNYSNGQGGFDKVLWIYDVETQQPYIQGSQDGIYYLTVMKGDVKNYITSVNGSANSPLPLSQNINYLYPTINQDAPEWNPVKALSKVYVSGTGSAAKSSDFATNFIGTVGTADYPYSTPDFYSISRESIETFLQFPSVSLPSGVTTATPYGSGSAFNATGKELAPSGRRVPLSSNYDVSLKRSSIIRASSHTWEYMGYGPGNYSTSFPSMQTIVLNSIEVINSQGIESLGGFCASTGTNSQGEFYIGNQVIRSGSDKSETINIPKIKYSSETRLIDYTDLSNQLTNSLVTNTAAQLSAQLSNVQQALQTQISGLANQFSTQNLSVSSSFTSDGTTAINGSLVINNNLISNNSTNGFPTASASGYGFVTKAATPFSIVDTSGYITPADLEQWRIARGIQTTTGTGGGENIVYIQPYRVTTLSAGISASDTSIPVASTDGFENSGYIEIEYLDGNGNPVSEIIEYTGKTSTSFTGCVRGQKSTSPAAHPQGRGVTLDDRYTWEEPYIATQGSSTVSYRAPRKVESWTGGVSSYVANNYVPNPNTAKGYGVNLQTQQATKVFKPFSTLAQAAEWANNAGLGVQQTIYLYMKPGYYFMDSANFPRKVQINGVEGSGVIGSYRGNDKLNKSVFLYRSAYVNPWYYPNHVSWDTDNGTLYFPEGLDLLNVHILSVDEAFVRPGISSTTFSDPSARVTLMSENPAIGNRRVLYIKKALENVRNAYLTSSSVTLQTAIGASDAMPKDVTLSSLSGWPFSFGAFKINNEVFEYNLKQTNADGTVVVTLNSRARDNTSAGTHTVGTTAYYYFPYAYGSTPQVAYAVNGNKFMTAIHQGVGAIWADKYMRLYNVTVGAQNNGNYTRITAWGGWRGGFFNFGTIGAQQGGELYLNSLRLRGNEITDWSVVYNGAPSGGGSYTGEIGHTDLLFSLGGTVNAQIMSSPVYYKNAQEGSTLNLDKDYQSALYFCSESTWQLEPTVDANGNIHGLDSRMFATSAASAIAATDTTITGYTSALQAWPTSGKGQIDVTEWFSYTGKTNNGNGTTTLTGVTRNIGGNVTTSQCKWRAGANIRLADFFTPDLYTNGVGWTVPNPSDSDWKKRGPKVTYLFGSRTGVKLNFFDYTALLYYGAVDSTGWVGKFGDGSYTWFLESGIDLASSQQYTNYLWRTGAPRGLTTNTPTVGLSNVTLGAAITSATQTSITLAASGDYDKIRGGVIKIGNELMYIEGGAGTTSLTVTRGYNRTIPTTYTNGTAVNSVDDTAISGGLTTYNYPALNLNVNRFGLGLDLTRNINSSGGSLRLI